MYEEAEKIIFELGLSDFNPELIKVLGRLKYRTSYGQNNLYHAREASYICGIMASELGLDVKFARRGALLHDIGKAVSHEEEGPHAMLGLRSPRSMVSRQRSSMPSRRIMSRWSRFARKAYSWPRLKPYRPHVLEPDARHLSRM
ncbi:MAG: HDIG domain-containing protein [Nitrospira sp.]